MNKVRIKSFLYFAFTALFIGGLFASLTGVYSKLPIWSLSIQILVLGTALAWLFMADKHRLKKTMLSTGAIGLPMAVYFIVSIITSITSVNTYQSLSQIGQLATYLVIVILATYLATNEGFTTGHFQDFRSFDGIYALWSVSNEPMNSAGLNLWKLRKSGTGSVRWRNEGQAIRISQIVLLLGVLMCIIGIYFYWGEVGEVSQPRMNSIFGNKNHFGGYLLLVIPLALALYFHAPTYKELVAAIKSNSPA